MFSHKAIVEFGRRHPDAAASLDVWYRVALGAAWKSFSEVRATLPKVDRVGDKYVFNIAHNRYRLIAEINFTYYSVFVRRILTHAEYDREDWR